MVPFSCLAQPAMDTNSSPPTTIFTASSSSKGACADSVWREAAGMGGVCVRGQVSCCSPGDWSCARDWTCFQNQPLLPETAYSLKSLWLMPLIGLLWFPGSKFVLLKCRTFFFSFCDLNYQLTYVDKFFCSMLSWYFLKLNSRYPFVGLDFKLLACED